MINLRLPNITAATEREQILQIKSYLHQLVGELNWALSSLEAENANAAQRNASTQADHKKGVNKHGE